MIQYFNRIIIESTVEKCGKLEDLCVVLTRGISHVEVLVERGWGSYRHLWAHSSDHDC